MGHKTTPNLFRLGTTKTWNSRWFADTNQYKDFIYDDARVRQFLKKKLNKHFVDKVEIERDGKKMTVIINTAKPGVVIGKNGNGADELKNEIIKIINAKNKKINVDVVIKEQKNADLSASILAEQARLDIEKRIPFRKVMKKIIDKAKQAGVKGIKISMAGRLNGVEIARRETLGWGSVPLHTIRADVDYANDRAETIYGSIGIKVWVYKGLVFESEQKKEDKEENVRKIKEQKFDSSKGVFNKQKEEKVPVRKAHIVNKRPEPVVKTIKKRVVRSTKKVNNK